MKHAEIKNNTIDVNNLGVWKEEQIFRNENNRNLENNTVTCKRSKEENKVCAKERSIQVENDDDANPEINKEEKALENILDEEKKQSTSIDDINNIIINSLSVDYGKTCTLRMYFTKELQVPRPTKYLYASKLYNKIYKKERSRIFSNDGQYNKNVICNPSYGLIDSFCGDPVDSEEKRLRFNRMSLIVLFCMICATFPGNFIVYKPPTQPQNNTVVSLITLLRELYIDPDELETTDPMSDKQSILTEILTRQKQLSLIGSIVCLILISVVITFAEKARALLWNVIFMFFSVILMSIATMYLTVTYSTETVLYIIVATDIVVFCLMVLTYFSIGFSDFVVYIIGIFLACLSVCLVRVFKERKDGPRVDNLTWVIILAVTVLNVLLILMQLDMMCRSTGDILRDNAFISAGTICYLSYFSILLRAAVFVIFMKTDLI